MNAAKPTSTFERTPSQIRFAVQVKEPQALDLRGGGVDTNSEGKGNTNIQHWMLEGGGRNRAGNTIDRVNELTSTFKELALLSEGIDLWI